MQDLENDMDDLFQRAAENYPLKNQKGDWDSVAKKIIVKDDADEITGIAMPKKSNQSTLFFIILFMLLAGGIMFYMFTNSSSKSNNLLAKKNGNNMYSGQLNNKVVGNKADADKLHHDQSIFSLNEEKNPKTKTKLLYDNFSNNTISGTGNTSYHIKPKVTGLIENDAMVNSTIENTDEDNADDAENKSLIKKTNPEILLLSKQEKEKVNIHKQKNDTSLIAEKNIRKKIADQKNKGLYMGIVTGINFSKVASGPFDNTGFAAGILLGFRVNKALSFETGFFWNKKHYTSDGKYFSMNKIRSSMPSGMIVDNVESESSLIEIPINAKFDLTRKKSSNVFISGGMSSYIMTMERNAYNASVNGNSEKVSGVYGKPDYGFATVVNFSVGYEHKISRTLNIRTEPFIKIPLQGIGVGNLPVTSAGIQISITGHLN
ncbi:MAG: outer membrane beta-barrel protein [Ginsengibacter sp.]